MLGLGGAMGLNFEVEGIWHTAIVVHNIEWFFGGGGIEHCPPGGTMMGQPLRREYLGETELDLETYRDYLFGLGQVAVLSNFLRPSLINVRNQLECLSLASISSIV